MITENLSLYGYRELDMVADLLKAYKTENDHTEFFDDCGVKPMFNQMSGYVFLTNENYDVAMMNGDYLEDWFICPYCGHEGFKEDMEHEPQDEDCIRYMEDIGLETRFVKSLDE